MIQKNHAVLEHPPHLEATMEVTVLLAAIMEALQHRSATFQVFRRWAVIILEGEVSPRGLCLLAEEDPKPLL